MSAGADAPTSGLQLQSLVTDEGFVEISLGEVAVPRPEAHQVVVRVEAAPINPSDLGLLFAGADMAEATRSGTEERPVVRAPLSAGAMRAAMSRVGERLPVGNEGAGTVVAAGASPEAQALAGRVVALAGGSTYSQYRCVPLMACLELPEGVRADQGAAAFVNPMTVLGMIETMRQEGHTALVHTAAASNLGQMLVRACAEEDIPLVNIVRSAAQTDLLRAAGATYVCDSSSDGFVEQLTEALSATRATLAFDAIGGGSVASRILSCMERVAGTDAEWSRYGSTVHKQVYVYGALDRSPTTLHRDFGMAWGIGGWLLTPFLQAAGPEKVAEMRRRVAGGITTTFASSFTDRVTLAGALQLDAIAAYGRQATGQKYLLTPNG